tara:strand:- start:17432 stop:18556 length:1125 start_codon:yes stop_codon:yes gene_type:complete
MRIRLYFFFICTIIIIALTACRDDDDSTDNTNTNGGGNGNSSPTPYVLETPPHFGYLISPVFPEDNPLTVEGIALGKKLFFEKKLSKDNSISCASCHKPDKAFNDEGNPFSFGVNGTTSIRNAMPLFNLAWVSVTSQRFNWHGNVSTLEEQAFGPVTDPREMQETWVNVVSKLQNDPNYPPLFKAAFETELIDSNLVVKAIAQFERTLISGNSRVDKHVIKNIAGVNIPGDNFLTAQELRGFDLFMQEEKGDCFHCHGDFYNPLWTDNEFRNNGLDLVPDSGLASVTKRASDYGKFKTPSLRNLAFSAPYMHDGRFNTIREVVDFYADDVQTTSPNLDATMKFRNLNNQEREDLVAFLMALTDSSFVNNTAFRP